MVSQVRSGITLYSHQQFDFAICCACYASIVIPLNLAHFFVPSVRADTQAKILCCFNPGHQRVQQFVDKAFCTFLTGNPAPFEAYVTEYASIPVCPRDVLVENRLWFGWNECTICPECHHDIVRVTTLANSMPLRGQRLSEPHMCEMYSPKMRQLYEKVSGEAPTDPSASELLEYAIQRRQLYHQLTDQKQHLQIKLAEHHALVSMSANFGTMGGAMHPLSGSNPYGASNISYGYALQGGVHSAQASVVIAELQQGGEVLIDLENRWKELE